MMNRLGTSISSSSIRAYREILAKVGKTPEQYKLYEHKRGHQPILIQPDEVVDLRADRVERFTTMPKDTTEGLETLCRRMDFRLPAADEEYLNGRPAVYLVSEHAGVATFAEPPPIDFRLRGVAIRPLFDKSLCFDTCLIIRADQNSKAVNEFGRAFLKKHPPQRLPPRQMDLPLPA
jgi:hypothetical protein